MRIYRAIWIAAAACAAHAWAGDNTWTPTGPSGASIAAVRYLPGNGRVAIAVTRFAIYRSTDDGGTWTSVQRFATAAQANRPCMLAVNPANGDQVLVAADSLYRSADRGLTWTVTPVAGLTGTGLGARCVSFTNTGNVAWVGGTQSHVHRSADGGATWELRNNGIPTIAAETITQIEVDAADTDVAYLRTQTSSALFRTQNGGQNWSWLTFPFPNETIEFSASRNTAGVLLRTAELYHQTMDRSSNQAGTWTPVAGKVLTTVRYSPATAGRALAYNNADQTLEFTENSGSDWTARAASPVYWPWDFGFDPASDDRILMGGDSGVLLSTDRGLTWTQRNAGLPEAWITDIHQRDDVTYLVTADQVGLYRQINGTGAWEAAGSAAVEAIGPPDGIGGSFAMTSGANMPLIFIRGNRVGRSLDNGATWTQIATLPNFASRLVWDPTSAVTGYVLLNGRMHKTVDGGFSWSLLTNGPDRTTDLAVDPSNPAHLVATQYPGTGAAVWRSLDGGTTWAPATVNTNHTAASPVFVPGASATVFVAAGADGIHRSSNGGDTWARIGDLPAGFVVSRLMIDHNATSVMYALDARDGGTPSPRVLRSVDSGATWESLDFTDTHGNTDAWTFALLRPGRGDIVVSRRNAGLLQMRIAPDLRLTSTGNMSATAAGSVVLTVTNHGDYAASVVQLTAELPVATGTYSVQATGGDCVLNQRQLECTANRLAPQAALSATIGFTASAAGSWQAEVEAREFDPQTSNNTLSLTVAAAPANPPPGGASSGGGGGGGRLDYLLLGLLGAFALARRRTSPVRGNLEPCRGFIVRTR